MPVRLVWRARSKDWPTGGLFVSALRQRNQRVGGITRWRSAETITRANSKKLWQGNHSVTEGVDSYVRLRLPLLGLVDKRLQP